MKAAIYLRVSTEDQNESNQLKECEQFAKSRGWEICEVFQERVSAYKDVSMDQKEKLLDQARRGSFNHIIVWAIDRWTRKGSQDLMESINILSNYNVELHSVQESFLDNFNRSDELGRIIRDFIAQLRALDARLESKHKSDRVKIAYQNHKGSWGRPENEIDYSTKLRVIKDLESMSIRKVAEKYDLKKHQVEKIKNGKA